MAVLPWGRLAFLALSVVATLAAYGIASRSAFADQRKYADLRARYPYVSMGERLPNHSAPIHLKVVSKGTAEELDELDKTLTESGNDMRARFLEQLHVDTVALFVNSPGFGVTRSYYPINDMWLTYKERKDDPIPRPCAGPPPALADHPAQPLPENDRQLLRGMHDGGVIDFVNAPGMGYVKDRRNVAGFQSHQFSKVPEDTAKWSVQSIDLVSLLLHAKPAAYVSAHLPRMDELRKAPTRDLDRFETSGLEKLRSGDDIYLRRSRDGIRMLGALRSGKECISCHGGERGDLLGAFSYALDRRAPGAGKAPPKAMSEVESKP